MLSLDKMKFSGNRSRVSRFSLVEKRGSIVRYFARGVEQRTAGEDEWAAAGLNNRRTTMPVVFKFTIYLITGRGNDEL